MKKLFSLLLCLVFVLAAEGTAFADVAIEPRDNSFYERHRGECSYENRLYLANGQDGYVFIYKSPVSTSPQDAAVNGSEWWVEYIYDGWGCVEYESGDDYRSGWIRMSQLSADYDSTAFFEEHRDEIDEKAVRSIEIKSDDTVYAWKYPGSGVVRDTLGNYTRDPVATVELGSIYTDSEGREWGYLGYYYGQRYLWICISDPMNGQLEADENYREPELVPAASQQEADSALSRAMGPNYVLVAGACGVAVIAAALLYVFIRKKRK